MNMTEEQILQKALEKAVKNGFVDGTIALRLIKGVNPKDAWDGPKTVLSHAYEIIFSHSFAKAFFKQGEKQKVWIKPTTYSTYRMKHDVPKKGYWKRVGHGGRSWQWHLQQMVLQEDPIKYLEKFI